MSRSAINVLAAISLALCLATAILWCSLGQRTHQLAWSSGHGRYALVLRHDGTGFCIIQSWPYREVPPDFYYAPDISIPFWKAIILFAALPVVWLDMKVESTRSARATGEGTIRPDKAGSWRWGALALLVGLAGLPICEGLAWLAFSLLPFYFCVVPFLIFPIAGIAFIYYAQSRCRHSKVGILGMALTALWVALLIESFFEPL